MPFDRCIAAALDGGLIDEDQAQDFQGLYGEELNARMDSMPAAEAAAEAGRATFAAIEGMAAEQRRRTFLQLAAERGIQVRAETFRDPMRGNRPDAHRAMVGVYSRILPGRNGLAVEQQHEFWRGQAQAFLDGAYDTWSRNWAGKRRNQPRMANVVHEAFGEQTGDAAAMALAQGWKKASEMLRQAFNRFGGHIGHLEDWGLPQSHDWKAVKDAGFPRWREAVLPLLDRSRMLDRATGRPMSDDKLNAVLRQVFDSIITKGWASRDVTSRAGIASLANRRDEARVLHFRTADAWLAYQGQFGRGDPLDAMFGHIDRMARDIGIMQVMGPNPNATLAWMKNYLSKASALAGDNRAARYNRILDRLHVNYTKSNAAPENPVYADLLDDASNIATAAQLGGAIIAAMPTDINYQRIARGFNGLPQWQALTSYLRRLDPTSPIDRQTAIRLGLGAEHFAQVLGEQGRYVGEIYGHKATRWIADRVLAASGLTGWTTAGRGAFGTDMYLRVAFLRDTGWDELASPFREYLTRYGLNDRDWDVIRATRIFPQHSSWLGREAHFIRPADILERQDLDPGYALDLASKLADAAQSETEFAVPSGSLETQAITAGLDAPGSARAAASRSFFKYKNFGITMMLTHGRRSMAQTTPFQKGRYAAALVVTSALAGAIGMMAKDIAAGRNPRSAVDENGVPDWRFWAAAMAQGGGAGILGDFAYAGLQGGAHTDQGLGTTLAGPLIGIPADLTSAVVGNVLDPASDRQPGPLHKGLDVRLLDFTKRYTPGGNLWWARLALEREVWDNIQEQIDPGWQQRVSRIESFYRRQYGQEFYWHHGESFPSEAPDLSAAVEGSK
jgi:hypothetical protein